MSRPLPADETVAVACRAAHRDLDRIARLFPTVREHRLRGSHRPSRMAANLPGLKGCVDDSELPPAQWADPTGETTVNAHLEVEHLDKRALLMVLDALARVRKADEALRMVADAMDYLRKARQFLASQMAAVDANVTANLAVPGSWPVGKPGTALVELAPLRERALIACTLCGTAVERIRGGLCDDDRSRWEVWKTRCWQDGESASKAEFTAWRTANLARERADAGGRP